MQEETKGVMRQLIAVSLRIMFASCWFTRFL